jgi:two-component system, OmpR family, heavy metal sensor histidine kinase CusS
VLAAVFLYVTLKDGIYNDDINSLKEQMEWIKTVVRQDPNLSGRQSEGLRYQYSRAEGMDYLMRARDEHGHIIYETPGLSHLLPSRIFYTPSKSLQHGEIDPHPRTKEGKTYVVAADVIDVGALNGGRRIIELAYDASSEVMMLHHYRDEIVVIILLGCIASTVAGVLITRRGLRPLTEITHVTHRISASQLNKRIGQRNWPKELSGLAAAFDEMLARLETSVARLSQFSADLAHELRTPVNNLIGEAEVTLSRRRTNEEYRDAIESSLEEYARLSRLTEDLLLLAKMDSDKMQINRSWLDARDMAEGIKSFFDQIAEEKGIGIRCEGKGKIGAEGALLRRALINLVSNSVKYTPPGGSIVIRVCESEADTEIFVSDNGSGIPAEHLRRVFDRFYRVDSARTADPGGSGLGLAIVQSIVKLHGGEIALDSDVRRGTIVTLSFPHPVMDEDCRSNALDRAEDDARPFGRPALHPVTTKF